MLKTINENYNVKAISLEKTIGGWAAEAFIVLGEDRKYFLKAYDKSRPSTAQATAYINSYSRLLEDFALRFSGDNVVQAIKCYSGNYYCENEAYVFMLFDYIEGETIAEKGLDCEQSKVLGQVIGQLHRYEVVLSEDIQQIKEDFDVSSYNDKLVDFLSSENSAVFNEVIETYGDLLTRLTERTADLSKQAKQLNPLLMLCHTDIHGWNLRQSEEALIVLDWETLRYAPKEADFFALTDLKYYDEFLMGYKQYHPNFELNSTLMDFYNCRRKSEDIWQFIEQILFEELRDDEVADILCDICRECEKLKAFNL